LLRRRYQPTTLLGLQPHGLHGILDIAGLVEISVAEL
jgi:hypothetical protein